MKKLLMTALVSGTFLTTGVASAMAQQNSQALESYMDGSTISVVGTVNNLSDDEFTLNSNGNMVDVDFREWDWTDNTDLRNHLQNGQTVVVNGTVDKDWFSDNEIEANNIYFRDNMNYYYVSDLSPAYYVEFNDSEAMEDGNYVSLRGTIASINGEEFELNSAQGMMMTVDTSSLSNDVDMQAMNLQTGDRVFVYGEMDETFFNNKELSADSLVKINSVEMRKSDNYNQ